MVDVVHHKKIAVPVFLPELPHFIVTNAVDHFIHETFAAYVGYDSVGISFHHLVADSVLKMSFSKAS